MALRPAQRTLIENKGEYALQEVYLSKRYLKFMFFISITLSFPIWTIS